MASWWTNPITSGTNRERPVTGEQYVGQSSSQSSAALTVVFTTVRGTVAALAQTERLARHLDFSVTLLVPQVVPYQVPVTRPPVAVEHTQKMALSLVSESAVTANDVTVQICFCRDRLECLRSLTGEPSIVFLGGRDSWWTWERRLATALRALGHDVILVNQKERSHARSVLRGRWSFVLCSVLGFR